MFTHEGDSLGDVALPAVIDELIMVIVPAFETALIFEQADNQAGACDQQSHLYVGLMLAISVHFKVTDVLRISYFWIDIAIPVGFVVIALYTFARGITQARTTFAEQAQ